MTKTTVYEIDIKNGWKICSKCENKKELNQFLLIKSRNSLKAKCKDCTSKEIKSKRKKYYKKAQEYRSRPENKKRLKIKQKEYRIRNKEKVRLQKRNFYLKNRDKNLKYAKNYRENPENKEKHKIAHTRWCRKQYRNSLNYNLHTKISRYINISLKGNKDWKSWTTYVDYSVEDLKNHIIFLFADGMTWESYLNGDIVIDHVIPKDMFEYDSPEAPQFKVCWGLNNLQPLWKEDNDKKSDYLPDGRRARNLNKEQKLEYLKLLGHNFIQ